MKKERRHDIDWLRVIAFYLLIIYHVGMVFVPWDYHIKNPRTYEWFETWMAILSHFRLPLLFIISGIGVYYALGFRSAGEFVKERSRRLLIPLIFGMLVIVPPQIYFEHLSNGIEYSSYWSFWATVFNFVPYPEGGSLSWHHLWFLPYIYVYALLGLPFFLYIRSERASEIKQKISRIISKPGLLYLLGIPLYVIYVTLSPIFPVTHALTNDWYTFIYSFCFFVGGFLLAALPGFWESIEKQRRTSLVLSLIPMFILVLFVHGPTFNLFDEQAASFLYIYAVLKISFVTFWLLAVLGYGRILFNKPGKFLTYANESVYPFYILHQTIIIAAAYYICALDIGLTAKFFSLNIITFAGCFLLYEYLIKRVNILRPLFGLKPKNK